MSDPISITPFELEVLTVCCDACNYSVNCHQPIEMLVKRINKSAGKLVKKVINKLVAKGLMRKHPTKGGMTYEPTTEGLNVVRGSQGNFEIV